MEAIIILSCFILLCISFWLIQRNNTRKEILKTLPPDYIETRIVFSCDTGYKRIYHVDYRFSSIASWSRLKSFYDWGFDGIMTGWTDSVYGETDAVREAKNLTREEVKRHIDYQTKKYQDFLKRKEQYKESFVGTKRIK